MVEMNVKTFKLSPLAYRLVEVFEIIYTEHGKANAFKYGINKNDLFQYQTKREYNAKIVEDVVKNGLKPIENLRQVTDTFDEKISQRPNKSKTMELPPHLFTSINLFIEEHKLTGQQFVLQALERTILRNNLDVRYIKSLLDKIKKYYDEYDIL